IFPITSSVTSLGIGMVRLYCVISHLPAGPSPLRIKTPVPRHWPNLVFSKTSSNHATSPLGERLTLRFNGLYVHPLLFTIYPWSLAHLRNSPFVQRSVPSVPRKTACSSNKAKYRSPS